METSIEKVFNYLLINYKINAVTVYTNQFDVYFLKIFYPNIKVSQTYIPNSVAFTDRKIDFDQSNNREVKRCQTVSGTDGLCGFPGE